ncbi:MAG: TIGR02996 domain-containing protein [Planctomycetes bacterium]|nr:TIGR02996 domain-containing protein [Planctomycetota bacterium]
MAKKPKPPADPWDVQHIEAKAPDAKSVTEARKVLTQGGFGKVEPRADGMGWWVVCKGLTGTYEVSVRRGPRGGLESRCSCPSSKKPCKHALALLLYLAEHPEERPESAAPAPRSTADFESLLRAAFAAPKDDTTRLVLADYLEENDQPDRAALIRAQCELARPADRNDGRKEAAEREKQALAAVWKQIGKIPVGFRGDFVRGFLRLTVGGTKIRSADGFPARFVKLFHDGWVESLRVDWLVKQMVPLYRLVGDLDFRTANMDEDALRVLVDELRPADPETRTRVVRVPAAREALYRALTRSE